MTCVSDIILTDYEGTDNSLGNLGLTQINVGQSFQIQEAATVCAMTFYGGRGTAGTQPSTFKIELRSGSYTGAVVATTGSLSNTILPVYTSPAWNKLEFLDVVSLDAGVTYYVVITFLSGSVNDVIRVGFDQTSPTYPYGSYWSANTENTGRDLLFRIHGTVGAPTYPSVTTNAVTAITTVSATLNGDITDIGGSDVDIRGFVYGQTSKVNPGDVAPALTDYDLDTTESGTFGIGDFALGVASLDSGTTYYVRAVAHNGDGYVYGDEVQFDTTAIVYAISGNVTLSGAAVLGATIRCIKQSDNTVLTQQTSDVNGDYEFTGLDVAELYHLCIEYETGGTKYNSESFWDIVPVAV